MPVPGARAGEVILRRPAANLSAVAQCLAEFHQAFSGGEPLEERLACGGRLVPALDALLATVTATRHLMWPDLAVLFARTGYGWASISSGRPALLSNGTFLCAGPLYTDLASMPQVGDRLQRLPPVTGGRV